MKRRNLLIGIGAIVLLGLLVSVLLLRGRFKSDATGANVPVPVPVALRLAIAPFQDMAMLAVAKPRSLDRAHGLDLQLVSMPWNDLTPAVSSANPSVDVAFASLIQFVTQEPNLNSNSSDPIVFFYPAYVFKGGAFVSFKPDVPEITKNNLSDVATLRKFLSHSFAVQKTSSYEILLFDLAKRANVPFNKVSRIDMDSGDGLLAAMNHAVDVSAAGLTQKNEALQKNGRVVLEMTALGQVDIAGFIAKQSTVRRRRADLEKMIKVWVASIDYVMSDLEKNSNYSLDYLRKQSSTDYTLDQYKTALSQELLPRRIDELHRTVIAPNAEYNYREVVRSVSSYYLDRGELTQLPKNIEFIEVH